MFLKEIENESKRTCVCIAEVPVDEFLNDVKARIDKYTIPDPSLRTYPYEYIDADDTDDEGSEGCGNGENILLFKGRDCEDADDDGYDEYGIDDVQNDGHGPKMLRFCGKAKCHEDDVWYGTIGRQIAFRRCMNNINGMKKKIIRDYIRQQRHRLDQLEKYGLKFGKADSQGPST